MQQKVLDELKRTGETSPMIKNVLTTATQSLDRLYDEDGNISEVGLQTVGMVDKLLTSDRAVALIGGKDKYRQWRILSLAANAGSGEQFTQRKLEGYVANAGKADDAGFSWSQFLGADQTKAGYIKGKLEDFGIRNPTRQQVTDYSNAYNEDLQAFGWDTYEADQSMKAYIQDNTTTVQGSVMHGAKFVNEGIYSMDTFIGKAQAGDTNVLQGKLSGMTGGKATYTNTRQVPNLKWYTKPGEDSIFASAPSLEGELEITMEEKRELSTEMKRRDDAEKELKAERAFRLSRKAAQVIGINRER